MFKRALVFIGTVCSGALIVLGLFWFMTSSAPGVYAKSSSVSTVGLTSILGLMLRMAVNSSCASVFLSSWPSGVFSACSPRAQVMALSNELR